MKPYLKLMQNIVWLTELGLSIIIPPLLCILLSVFLQNRLNLGVWVVIVGIVVGLGGSVCSGISFYNITMRKAHKEQRDIPVSFNEHD